MNHAHHARPEPHVQRNGGKLNRLRAAVLGANDGIVSVAGIVVGVAGATNSAGIILAGGLAGLTAGAISMAAGEYVSVSSQRDTEKALLEKERYELEHFPAEELKELTGLYEAKGLQASTARQVAQELTAKDAFAAHVDIELGIDPHDLTSPWQAAGASAASFLVGGVIPLAAILIPPQGWRVPVTFLAVVVALAITGVLSAKVGNADVSRATARVVIGGVLAMVVTYAVGRLVGVSGI